MSRRAKRRLIVGSGAIALLVAVGVTLHFRPGATQDAPTPKLFSLGYDAGHELAGFSGRPMLLVFGDSRVAGWSEFLVDCEGDPALSKLLSESFQGVFVDSAVDKEAMATYGEPEQGTVLVKDLHGPIRGVIEKGVTCKALADLLDGALPFLSTGKSPAYTRLLKGTDLLDELVGKGEPGEAGRVVRLLKHFEPGKECTTQAEAKATELKLTF